MKYKQKKDAIVVLEDGTVFKGKAVSPNLDTAYGEICFNTGMTGYQEIFTDPSYFGQIMVTANVHIGNYGVKNDEAESNSVKIAGLVCKNFSFNPSRYESDGSLEDYLDKYQTLAISDVDTRALVSHIRDNGSMNAVITTKVDNLDAIKKQLSELPSMKGLELASKVSTKEAYEIVSETEEFKVSVLDLGVKSNILRHLSKRNCSLKVFPWNASFDDLMSYEPDAIFLSNGPGDPMPLTSAIDLAKKALEKHIPMFGICLGHQIISLAMGLPTFKMHNGHRGINHPVINLVTGKSEITSQNHGFAVDKTAAENHPDIEVTHLHLNDDTLAGIKIKNKPCFSVQYHPEAGPGPNDATYLFDDFIDMIKSNKA